MWDARLFLSFLSLPVLRENSLSAFLKGCEINLEFNFMLLILSVQVLNGDLQRCFYIVSRLD